MTEQGNLVRGGIGVFQFQLSNGVVVGIFAQMASDASFSNQH
ncbi:hypothetical protein GYH30_039856 [Glycine max]|nr:hypothetical protein GYH30_039856 [Glycine max]